MDVMLASQPSKDEEEKRRLLVAEEQGLRRVDTSRLLEELSVAGRRRNTRDSWVQTDKPSPPIPEQQKMSEVLAPLASEEEFCSDSEPKPCDEAVLSFERRSPLPQVKQPNSVTDLDPDALMLQVATMPGGRDACGRSIVYISLEKAQQCVLSAAQLAEMLLYFQSLPKREVMCLGFLLVVDGRQVTADQWIVLYKALACVEECVPGTIGLVLALHRQSERSSFLSRFPIFHIKFEPIVNENQLLQYVKKEQLLPHFGGTFEDDHNAWIQFHKCLDPFIISCHQMGCRLVKWIQDFRCEQSPSTLSTEVIKQQKKQIAEVLGDEQLHYLEVDGAGVLQQLDKYKTMFPNNQDYEDAVEKSKTLYKQLKKVVQRLSRLADKRLNKLQERMMKKVFEEESTQVLSWLQRKGEETLKKHRTLAETLNAIREQENEFEKFYFLAMRQIERGNDLLEEIPKSRSNDGENGMSANLKRQLDDFTNRLEEAREKLEDTSRCYHLLDKVYEWALETMRYVSLMKVDSSTSIHALAALLKRLDAYLQAHPYIEDAVFEEMMLLATKLNNNRLLNQCQLAKDKYDETVDLVQARCEALQKSQEQLFCNEKPNLNESLDDLKTKPCLWNPYRATSQMFLGNLSGALRSNREPVGSYTSFPSSYYPTPGFKDRLLIQKKSRMEHLAKRGSLTEEAFLSHLAAPNSPLKARKSYPFTSDSMSNLNVESPINAITEEFEALKVQNAQRQFGNSHFEDVRNRKMSELQWFTDEVKQQNLLLEQQPLIASSDNVNMKSSSTASNPEVLSKPAPVNSHLTRCASCSDFEDLISSKNSEINVTKSKGNSRTLKLVMMEMIQTERDYVKSLGYIIENYVPLLQKESINQTLRSQRNVLFGNIEKIYEFHNCYFLGELEQCESIPYSVGQCFLKYEKQFYLYALYNKNKPKSDSLMAEYGNHFFKKKQQELGDKMDLASYLLKPVQRMGKYALLLKQLLKECPDTNSEYYSNLKAAEEMVCFQLRHGNDLLAMDALRECDVNIKEQGRLLRQEEFLLWQGKSKKALRHVFLFEDLILFSKAKRDPECKGHDSYQYKYSIKTSDLGLTAQVGESPTKFEIWFRKCKAQDLYVLQAPSAEVKNAWVEEITSLLWKQAERNRKLRLQEMCSMGIGNKPCLDITPSRDQICDRSISLQQLNKVPRFRNSIAICPTDNLNNNEPPRRRPMSIISLGGSSSTSSHESAPFYDPLVEMHQTKTDKRRSVTQQSQCSAESGIFTDLSTSGDSYVENVQRLKTVERSDSVLSRTSCGSLETEQPIEVTRPVEISTAISPSAGMEV